MVSIQSSVCLILKSEDEVAFFKHMMTKMGFENITTFTDSKEGLKKILKTQYDFFIMRMEMPQMPGLVVVQKMRETGNYGMETHLVIADKIDSGLISTLSELDMPYVLVKPFNWDRFTQKVKHILKIESNLSEFESLFRSAKSALTGNLVEMAEDIVGKMKKIDSNHEKCFTIQGDIEMAKGDPAAARQHFEACVAQKPKATTAYHKLAQTYLAEENYEEADKILSVLSEHNTHNIKLLENAGLTSYKVGNIEAAEKQMAKVRELDETNKVSGEVLSNIYIDRNDFEAMEKVLASSHSPKDLVSYLNNQGVKLAKQKKYSEAIKVYLSCLEKAQDNPHAYAILYNAAIAYRKLKDNAKAKEFLIRSIELSPNYQKAIDALKSIESQ